MFGVVVASRPVVTDFEAVSPSQFAFALPQSPAFSHIVVFLLPGNVLPTDSAAGVHLRLPGATEFQFLGVLSNEKPSAIFRVNHAETSGDPADPTNGASMSDEPIEQPSGDNLVLGISVEPAASVQQQAAQKQAQQAQQGQSALVKHQPPVTTKTLAQRIIQDAFNFLSSFSTGSPGQETVQIKTFQDWWNKFQRKVDLDPSFLERVSD